MNMFKTIDSRELTLAYIGVSSLTGFLLFEISIYSVLAFGLVLKTLEITLEKK